MVIVDESLLLNVLYLCGGHKFSIHFIQNSTHETLSFQKHQLFKKLPLSSTIWTNILITWFQVFVLSIWICVSMLWNMIRNLYQNHSMINIQEFPSSSSSSSLFSISFSLSHKSPILERYVYLYRSCMHKHKPLNIDDDFVHWRWLKFFNNSIGLNLLLIMHPGPWIMWNKYLLYRPILNYISLCMRFDVWSPLTNFF